MLLQEALLDSCQDIPIANGKLFYWPQFLSIKEANYYFDLLQVHIIWHTPRIKLFGKEIDSPRMAAWYGDENAIYTYSGLTNQPLPWFDELSEIKHCIEQQAQYRFNSVLANFYRDGNDSMGWHSDNESELGLNPVIASLSLGEERKFVLRHKRNKAFRPVEIYLEHGSLLVMAGETQHNWRHSIPKTRKAIGPRVNLTFRLVKNNSATKN